MSPTAAAGAATALLDAATLSQGLTEEGSQVENVARYESLMRQYARQVLIRSSFIGKHVFGMRPFEGMKSVMS